MIPAVRTALRAQLRRDLEVAARRMAGADGCAPLLNAWVTLAEVQQELAECLWDSDSVNASADGVSEALAVVENYLGQYAPRGVQPAGGVRDDES